MLAIVLLAGCDSTIISDFSCETATRVDRSNAALGFDADDVLAFLSAAPRPSTIVWDGEVAGAEHSPVAVSLYGVASTAWIVENTCGEAPTVLRVPLDASVALDDGAVVGRGPFYVDVADLDSLESIALSPWGDSTRWTVGTVPVDLSGQFADAFEAQLADGELSGGPAEGLFFGGRGAWAEAEVEIQLRYSTEHYEDAATVWSGHWQL